MSFFQFFCRQDFPVGKEVVWDFISSAENLAVITPPNMNFEITSPDIPKRMYAGMIISYKVSPFPFYRATWVTEITQIDEGRYFVDEQRVGPYNMWHHQHILDDTPAGVSMRDIVSYRPPFGLLGDIVNGAVIRSKLEWIFEYRKDALRRMWGDVNWREDEARQ